MFALLLGEGSFRGQWLPSVCALHSVCCSIDVECAGRAGDWVAVTKVLLAHFCLPLLHGLPLFGFQALGVVMPLRFGIHCHGPSVVFAGIPLHFRPQLFCSSEIFQWKSSQENMASTDDEVSCFLFQRLACDCEK